MASTDEWKEEDRKEVEVRTTSSNHKGMSASQNTQSKLAGQLSFDRASNLQQNNI